jgi:hypothetical protein
MDAVWLPVLWKNESLKNAVTAMKEAKTSGLLVEGDERFDVVMLESVEQALGRGVRTLGEVQDREPALLPEPGDAAARHLDLIRPLRTGMEYQELLDNAGRTYALVAHAYDWGLVVTRHESGRQALSRSNTYYCRGGTRTHYFPRPEVQVGEECPKCLGQPKGQIFLR